MAEWMNNVKNELKKSPLAQNLCCSMILVLLEKLVEMEFACPCTSKNLNAGLAFLFFILPGILSFTLMMHIQGCKCDMGVLLCFISPMVWFTLTLLDGQYYACAMTGWSGSYEKGTTFVNLKWCKPYNTSRKTSEEFQRMTQDWFFDSQFIGMGFIAILIVIIALYHMIKCFKPNNKDPGPSSDDETTGIPLTGV